MTTTSCYALYWCEILLKDMTFGSSFGIFLLLSETTLHFFRAKVKVFKTFHEENSDTMTELNVAREVLL